MIFSLFDFKNQIRKEDGQKEWAKEHYKNKKVNYKNKEVNQKNKEHIYKKRRYS